MKTYNFKAQFADDVEHDQKLTTIRKAGKRPPPAVGENIRRYTGMRTKHCRCLGDRICTAVSPLRINSRAEIFLGGARLASLDRVTLAVGDGFSSVKDFINFFKDTHGLPFKGFLIRWAKKGMAI